MLKGSDIADVYQSTPEPPSVKFPCSNCGEFIYPGAHDRMIKFGGGFDCKGRTL